MERRLLKDFQIGIVEGIVQDVISSEHEPKDLFSQLAKAIGGRSNESRLKHDIIQLKFLYLNSMTFIIIRFVE